MQLENPGVLKVAPFTNHKGKYNILSNGKISIILVPIIRQNSELYYCGRHSVKLLLKIVNEHARMAVITLKLKYVQLTVDTLLSVVQSNL